jgi:hypothetical protein
VKLRAKIVSTYIGLAIISILLAGILSSWEIRRDLEDRFASDLRSRARLISTMIGNGSLPLNPDSLGETTDIVRLLEQHEASLHQIAAELQVRLMLVLKNGTVLFDSDTQFDSSTLPEKRARRFHPDGSGSTARLERTVYGPPHGDSLVAGSVITGSHAGILDSGSVIIFLPTTEIDVLGNRLRTVVALVGLVTVAVVVFAGLQLSKRIATPILRIAEIAQSIPGGT